MQDRTINNALKAIYKAGGEQADLAEKLLTMRGRELPRRDFDRPLWKGQCRAIVLEVMRGGSCTTKEVADRLQEALPNLPRKKASQRAYMALLRMEARGLVRREGRVWLAL